MSDHYSGVLIPLLLRIQNLDELGLHFMNACHRIIDGDILENNFINHMTRLNKFTFNICSVIRPGQSVNLPSTQVEQPGPETASSG